MPEISQETASGRIPHLTFRGTVQSWECDRNDHMNVRFYVRAFQMASEVFTFYTTGRNPGAASTKTRYTRFHRELFKGDPFSVRSARVADGEFQGAVIHMLESNGRICATALDAAAVPAGTAPDWPSDAIDPALPRSLSTIPHRPLSAAEAETGTGAVLRSSVGIVQPGDLDRTGAIIMNELFARCSASSYNLLDTIGFSREWIDATGLTRMAVELKITRHGTCPAGEALRVRSSLSEVRRRTFAVRHELSRARNSSAVASLEQMMLVVDLRTRHAASTPDFVFAAFEGAGRYDAQGRPAQGEMS